MKAEIGRLVKHAGIYGLGSILSKSLGFLLIPLYTRFLAPAAFGWPIEHGTSVSVRRENTEDGGK